MASTGLVNLVVLALWRSGMVQQVALKPADGDSPTIPSSARPVIRAFSNEARVSVPAGLELQGHFAGPSG